MFVIVERFNIAVGYFGVKPGDLTGLVVTECTRSYLQPPPRLSPGKVGKRGLGELLVVCFLFSILFSLQKIKTITGTARDDSTNMVKAHSH